MKIVLCGQRTFGRMVLDMLLKRGDDIRLVSSPFRSKEGREDRLYTGAVNARLPILEAGRLNADTMPSGVDLIIAAHSHDYLSQKTLGKAKLGGIGYHPSLLPRHRGRDAVRWAVKMGDPVTGGTVYWLTAGSTRGRLLNKRGAGYGRAIRRGSCTGATCGRWGYGYSLRRWPTWTRGGLLASNRMRRWQRGSRRGSVSRCLGRTCRAWARLRRGT